MHSEQQKIKCEREVLQCELERQKEDFRQTYSFNKETMETYCKMHSDSWVYLFILVLVAPSLSAQPSTSSEDCFRNRGLQAPPCGVNKYEKNGCCESCSYCLPGTGQSRDAQDLCLAPCLPCELGKTYSAKSDYKKACMSCTNCTLFNRGIDENCTLNRNTQCGECSPGYYEPQSDYYDEGDLVTCWVCTPSTDDDGCRTYFKSKQASTTTSSTTTTTTTSTKPTKSLPSNTTSKVIPGNQESIKPSDIKAKTGEDSKTAHKKSAGSSDQQPSNINSANQQVIVNTHGQLDSINTTVTIAITSIIGVGVVAILVGVVLYCRKIKKNSQSEQGHYNQVPADPPSSDHTVVAVNTPPTDNQCPAPQTTQLNVDDDSAGRTMVAIPNLQQKMTDANVCDDVPMTTDGNQKAEAFDTSVTEEHRIDDLKVAAEVLNESTVVDEVRDSEGKIQNRRSKRRNSHRRPSASQTSLLESGDSDYDNNGLQGSDISRNASTEKLPEFSQLNTTMPAHIHENNVSQPTSYHASHPASYHASHPASYHASSPAGADQMQTAREVADDGKTDQKIQTSGQDQLKLAQRTQETIASLEKGGAIFVHEWSCYECKNNLALALDPEESPTVQHWFHFGLQLGIPEKFLKNMRNPGTGKEQKTTAVLSKIGTENQTVLQVLYALQHIQRYDCIEVIDKCSCLRNNTQE